MHAIVGVAQAGAEVEEHHVRLRVDLALREVRSTVCIAAHDEAQRGDIAQQRMHVPRLRLNLLEDELCGGAEDARLHATAEAGSHARGAQVCAYGELW